MNPQKPLQEYLQDLVIIYKFLNDFYEKTGKYPLISECSESLNMENVDLTSLTKDQDNILCLLDDKKRLGFHR